MTDRTSEPEDLDLQELDPDDTAEQLHPSTVTPSAPDPADDDFAEEPEFEENDG